MQDQEFLQANKVFTGRMHDNKEKGLDVSKARAAIEQNDLKKLFNVYFLEGLNKCDTEVLLHKIFFDIIYYTGRRGKEGLRNLRKSSFQLKVGAHDIEYIEMTFNEKTKKNQGNSNSASLNTLHNDRNIVSAQDGDLCPVKSYKTYVSLLNPDVEAFSQYPNDAKTRFTAKVVGKNTLGTMMSDISTKANLSKNNTNHGIRKTTVTAMKRSGFSLQQIANVTKHKNLESLKHYISAPIHEEKETYVNALHKYGTKRNARPLAPKEPNQEPLQKQPKQDAIAPIVPISPNNETIDQNIPPENCVVPMYPDNSDSNASSILTPKQQNSLQNILNNQMRHSLHMFQNATFHNCQFSFNLPK